MTPLPDGYLTWCKACAVRAHFASHTTPPAHRTLAPSAGIHRERLLLQYQSPVDASQAPLSVRTVGLIRHPVWDSHTHSLPLCPHELISFSRPGPMPDSIHTGRDSK